jgi:hypothetical protein
MEAHLTHVARSMLIGGGYDELSDDAKAKLIGSLRQGILAMRKPSLEMIRAGQTVMFPRGYEPTELDIIIIWERMIDVVASR